MQIAVRTNVLSPGGGNIGRIVLLAEAPDHKQALIIEFRVIGEPSPKFPELQGALIRLDVPDGEMPPVEKDGQVICYLCGEASQFHITNAAEYYIKLCQESGAEKPRP